MKTKLNPGEFIEDLLIAEFNPEAFTARLATLTGLQQMNVLMDLLKLWLGVKKEEMASDKKRAASSAKAEKAVGDIDSEPSLSENMRRVLGIISGRQA